jgi:hypothetical protein
VLRAGNALVEATKGLLFCIIKGGASGGQVGLALGVVISPVCAIAAGIDGARDETQPGPGRNTSDVFGKSLESDAIQAWLRDDVLRISETGGGYALRFIPTPELATSAPPSDPTQSDAPVSDAKLVVTIKRVVLREVSKNREADPVLPLVVEADAALHRVSNEERIAFIQIAHAGEKRPLSKWLADDGAQLKEGMRIASRALGESIHAQISGSNKR